MSDRPADAAATGVVDISVIVVNWNTSALLARCLASLEREAPDLSLQVIAVDNGSTDGSVELVRGSFPGVELIANPGNRGFSAANNQGMRRATGRYLLLLNSDARVEAGALRALVRYADQHPEVGIAGPQLVNPDGTLQPSGGKFPTPASTIAALLGLHRVTGIPRYGTRRDYSVPAEVDEVSGAAMMIARSVAERLNGLDEGFVLGYEDVDLCRRARQAGWRIHYVPAAKVVHEWGASRRIAPASTTLKAIAGRQRYFRKHFGSFQASLVMLATVVSHLLRMALFGAGGLRSGVLRERAKTEGAIVRGLIGRGG